MRNLHINITYHKGDATVAKTDVIRLRIEPELKAQAAAKAAEEGRSLSNYIETLIRREMKKEG